MALGRVLLDAPAIEAVTGVPAGTIRNWASDGVLTRHGPDQRGRVLYDLDDVVRLGLASTRQRHNWPRLRECGV
ncbi:MAG TPA: MerR family transcriptional regulator [Mycobacterium sp.]|jgi:hypothetical protein|uniref:MerR family transcriptional regulator n=1 Tax=Mycobacterium sp. TaxID=1785 RepID=UPI002F413E20